MAHHEFRGNWNIARYRIREARKKLDLTQEDLVARLQVLRIDIDQVLLSRIENNERVLADFELAGLAKALSVTADWLLEDFETILESDAATEEPDKETEPDQPPEA